MQTALRNGIRTTWFTAKARFGRSWVPPGVEATFFDGWNEIYAEIRRSKIAEGSATVAPADTRQLHRRNVVPLLDLDHGKERRLAL